jgi:RHS repeat-associated protein
VLRTYYYDTNPLDSTGFSQNTLGRLAAVQYANVAQNPDVGSTPLPIQMNDMYSYTAYTAAGAGLPAAKRLQVNQLVSTGTGHVAETANLDSTYTYNNEGKLTAISYPGTTSVSGTSVPGASYNYYYDSMYRLSSMTTSGGTTVVNGVSYNAANQLLGMTYNGIAETRGYNVLNQLTSLSAQENATTVENLTYNYPTGTNNGKISYMSNALSGEKISYTYDSLNRMIAASDSIGQTVQWAEGYTFDPFGNLTAKAVTGGTQGGPSLSVAISQVNNQIETYYYDANGNGLFGNATAYDVENHVSGGGWSNGAPVVDYGYDAQSRRFLMLTAGTVDSYGNANNYLVVEYSPRGQKLGTYQINTCNDSSTNQPVLTVCSTLSTSDQYFGGRRLAVIDPLGSAGTYYPWGEDKGSTNPQDTWSFATYWRDSATGLDYADNRYYSNAYGRFMTPDPYRRSAHPRNPQSWNRYAYALGDPVNRNDPKGLCSYNDWDYGMDEDSGELIVLSLGWVFGYDGDCLIVTEADLADESDSDYADQQLQLLGQYIAADDPEGFLNAFMALSVTAGAGVGAGLAAAAADGFISAEAIMLGSSTGVDSTTGTVLSGYIEIGGVLNAQTLNIPTAVWNGMSALEQQAEMAGFINAALEGGADIVFSTNPALAAPTSGLAFEYEYITETLGMQVVQEGTSWVAVLPSPPPL